MSHSRPLDLRAEESGVLAHVSRLRFGEASRKPRAINQVRTLTNGWLAHGFTHWATRAPNNSAVFSFQLYFTLFSNFNHAGHFTDLRGGEEWGLFVVAVLEAAIIDSASISFSAMISRNLIFSSACMSFSYWVFWLCHLGNIYSNGAKGLSK